MSKSFFWIVPLLLAILVNLNVLQNGFVWDDLIVLEEEIPLLDTIGKAFKPSEVIQHDKYYRPIITLIFMLAHKIWSFNAFGYHLIVLLFHLLNTLLFFFLVKRALIRYDEENVGAMIASSVFAVHPAHIESVAWVAGISDVIAAFFMLASFYLYIRYIDNNKVLLLIFSIALYLFGLMSKEVAISLLLIFPLYDLLYTKNRDKFSCLKTGVLRYLPYLSVTLLYFWLRFIGRGGLPGFMRFSIIEILHRAVISYGYYAKLLILPLNHNAFIVKIPDSLSFIIFSYIIIMAIICFFCWYYQRSDKIMNIAMAWFLLTLSPSVYIAAAGNISMTPLAERYTYIPSMGFSVIMAILLLRFHHYLLSERFYKIGLAFTCILILTLYSTATIKGNTGWRDDITFWTRIVERSPVHPSPYYNLGNAYARIGRLEEAISEYREALRITPNDIDALINLGNVYAKTGRLEDAVLEYKKALKIEPNLADAHNNLGVIYRRLGRYEEAMWEIDRAVELGEKNERNK